MSGRFLPTSANRSDWPRLVAESVNALLRRLDALTSRVDVLSAPDAVTFTPTTAPSDPAEGTTYYDTTAHKLMTWDGTQWQAHW